MIADEILRAVSEFIFDALANSRESSHRVFIDVHTNDHAFLQGHRIMVQVQSTWFPVYDRNPQRFVPNIFLARDSDYIVATQRVFRSGRYPSHLTLPIIR